MSDDSDRLNEIWQKSRHGAWASRGFRFQDAATALIAVRLWQGAFTNARIVPEGLDDIAVEYPNGTALFQAKSKSPSAKPFSAGDLARFNAELKTRSERYENSGVAIIATGLLLERLPTSEPRASIGQDFQVVLSD